MIILTLSIVLHYCFTKTSDLTFIRFHNVRLQYFFMVVTTSMRAPSWHDNVSACGITHFVPYQLHKFRLMLSLSYLWVWHLSVLTSCHIISTDYVRIQPVYFFSFFLRLHAVETYICTIFLCLQVVSCPVSFCIHSGFDSFFSCLHVGLNFFLGWPNLNQISNSRMSTQSYFTKYFLTYHRVLPLLA